MDGLFGNKRPSVLGNAGSLKATWSVGDWWPKP